MQALDSSPGLTPGARPPGEAGTAGAGELAPAPACNRARPGKLAGKQPRAPPTRRTEAVAGGRGGAAAGKRRRCAAGAAPAEGPSGARSAAQAAAALHAMASAPAADRSGTPNCAAAAVQDCPASAAARRAGGTALAMRRSSPARCAAAAAGEAPPSTPASLDPDSPPRRPRRLSERPAQRSQGDDGRLVSFALNQSVEPSTFWEYTIRVIMILRAYLCWSGSHELQPSFVHCDGHSCDLLFCTGVCCAAAFTGNHCLWQVAGIIYASACGVCWLRPCACCMQGQCAARSAAPCSALRELLGAVDTVCNGRCGAAAQAALDDACAAQSAAAVRLAVDTADLATKSRQG